MARFKIPKYGKGDTVMTPDGEGVIDHLSLSGSDTWYEVNGTYYSYREVTLIAKAKPRKTPQIPGLPF